MRNVNEFGRFSVCVIAQLLPRFHFMVPLGSTRVSWKVREVPGELRGCYWSERIISCMMRSNQSLSIVCTPINTSQTQIFGPSLFAETKFQPHTESQNTILSISPIVSVEDITQRRCNDQQMIPSSLRWSYPTCSGKSYLVL